MQIITGQTTAICNDLNNYADNNENYVNLQLSRAPLYSPLAGSGAPVDTTPKS